MGSDNSVGVFQILTFGIAVVGAALGVFNTWRSWSRDQPKLRVRCIRGFTVGHAPSFPSNMFGIEVTNLSTFPLVISEVGFGLRGTTDRMLIPHPYLLDSGPWPRTLAPRDQVTAYTDADSFDRSRRVKDIYASTVCGTTVRRKQKKLEQLLAAPERKSNHTGHAAT